MTPEEENRRSLDSTQKSRLLPPTGQGTALLYDFSQELGMPAEATVCEDEEATECEDETPTRIKARIGCHDEGVVTCVALTP